METYELKLIAKLLEMASEKFSNNSCNDLPSNFFDELSEQQKEEFLVKLNSFGVDIDQQEDYPYSCYGDSSLMYYFADKLKSI